MQSSSCLRNACTRGNKPAPTAVGARNCTRRAVLVCASAEAPSSTSSISRRVKLPVLSAVSRAVEIQGLTAKFESLAGRSAMLGTTTALAIESLTDEGLFHGGGDQLLFLSIAGVTLVAALLAVVQNKSPDDFPLLEPVMASLTAAKRSGAAVKDAQVDSVVDDVIKASFSASIMSSLVVNAIIDDSQLI